MKSAERWTGVSLFAGAGIGDLGLRAGGVDFLALAEADPKRASLARQNFPEAEVFACDFRLLVCDTEPEFWPHPGVPRPEGILAIRAWWLTALVRLEEAREHPPGGEPA